MRTEPVVSGQDFALTRITVDVPMDGFEDFITPWLITEAETRRAIVIDPGPASGIRSLERALEDAGVKRLDLVVLTHIHIDHAGGVGHLLQAFPEAKIVVHPRGARHLADPSVLWRSTVETLGKDVAYAYGDIIPVPKTQILNEHETPERFEVVRAEGHSQHHRCYLYHSGSGGLVFVGEAAGVYLGNGYLRPATPPRFFYGTAVRSIAAIRERAGEAQLMLYAHRGYSRNVAGLLDAALRQMALWKKTAEAVIAENPSEPLDRLVGLSVSSLLETDPFLARFQDLPPETKDREMYFLRNSARGFISAELHLTSA